MLRSLAGKTQEDIAEVIGISRQAYAKWERGETIPDIEKCGRLAEFYGVTMDSLIKDDVQLEGQKMAPAPKGKHMWGVVTVNDRGQIVIPKEARETFGLVNGSRLVVLGDDNEGIALVKAEQFEEKLSMLCMICPKCNKEMRKGYLFSSKDGAFSFADEVPGVFTNAKTAKGFVEITPLKASHRTKVEAYICENCRIVEFEY